jgi:thiol:disulfide interchange protein DsbD
VEHFHGGHVQLRVWISLILMLLAGQAQGFTGASASIRGEHVQVQILSEEMTLRPGATQTFALRFQPDPRWHVYWKNPGDSGEPPRLEWKKPEGWSLSEFSWPVPQRIQVGPFYNIGYEGEVVLPFQLTVPPDQTGDAITLEALARWLVCEEECIPGQHLFSWTMPLQKTGASQAGSWAPIIAQARAQAPAGRVQARLESADDPQKLILTLHDEKLDRDAKLIDYFPEEGSGLKNAPPELKDRSIILQKSAEPITREIGGVVVFARPDGQTLAYDVELGRTVAVPEGLWSILILAFLGGLILNVMPCVLPVLAIKVLSLLRESGENRRKVRLGSLAYGAGVLLSFLALAGLLLLFKAGGEAVGWGFQLQSPVFIAALAILFFLMAFNFLDLIQPWNAFTRLGQLEARQSGPAGHFLSGVLAVIVASPCTGPFMGVALGSALTRTAGEALLIFAGLGLGFLSPFIALAWIPGSRRLLPKPGSWMESFRQAMAFPLLLTILWLLWVLEKQNGMNGVLWILGSFIGLGFCAWLWRQKAERSAGFGWGMALVMLLISGVAVYQQKQAAASAVQSQPENAADVWEVFSAEKLAAARKEGPVFVDFTAAWCVTCQVSKTLVLNREDIQKAFQAHGIRLLRADWTDYNPEITRMLESLGRQGVPVYALYADAVSEPRLLPEVLTPDLLMEEIRRVNPNAKQE